MAPEVPTTLPTVVITAEQCKGCELCIRECPKNCLSMSDKFNQLGYVYAKYDGEGCTGCGICFYACPEPGTITVYKK
ncbi:MAG: 4Fe-4S binding protein [Bdellovibrionales bacterium]|jgi:2-oxoglutarate ferredoxin oxidoreductase subunit delta|nr:4Fe-4S binding protein [Bdellovibrionales bacterium]MBT3525938.1 4Fe-4S binding protein [Bdellovibrionales bacterium]MBT7767075.1 4Fe-4S binding protein [Bdellovibrionales bacterium]